MKTIEEVLIKLDEIIDWSKENKSPVGYFACTYRATTAQVLRNVQQKKFEDNARMVQMDVAFAVRYLDAWENYQKGKKCTKSWIMAFDATQNSKLLIMHHIFLGMNAHINLDLGFSAASVVPARKINPLKNDFNKINSVIASINQNVQNSLNEICYPIKLVDQISQGKDNSFLNFSISKAREMSWATAQVASNTPKYLLSSVEHIVDYATARVGNQILHPQLIASPLLKELKACESQDVAKNIEILQKIKNV
jgi:hypothetical protein